MKSSSAARVLRRYLLAHNVEITTKGSVVTFSIGSARIHTKLVGSNYKVIDAHAPDEMRGQGIGKAMYRALFNEAMKNGKGVLSDATVEEPAARVWESLKREGFPIHKSPRAESTEVEGVTAWFVPGLQKPVFWLAA